MEPTSEYGIMQRSSIFLHKVRQFPQYCLLNSLSLLLGLWATLLYIQFPNIHGSVNELFIILIHFSFLGQYDIAFISTV